MSQSSFISGLNNAPPEDLLLLHAPYANHTEVTDLTRGG